MMDARCIVPSMHHALESSLSSEAGRAAWCICFLKTRSFYISQVTRMNKLHIAFLYSVCTLITCSHHPWIASADGHWDGCRPTRPSQVEIMFQTRMEYLHLAKRCTTVFGNWRHSAHWLLFGQPRCCSQSEVYSLFWMDSHAKCLHFDGA